PAPTGPRAVAGLGPDGAGGARRDRPGGGGLRRGRRHPRGRLTRRGGDAVVRNGLPRAVPAPAREGSGALAHEPADQGGSRVAPCNRPPRQCWESRHTRAGRRRRCWPARRTASLPSQARAHPAAGNTSRPARAQACQAVGLRVARVPQRELSSRAAAALRQSPQQLTATLKALGSGMGSPWGADQKDAALLAWLLLAA